MIMTQIKAVPLYLHLWTYFPVHDALSKREPGVRKHESKTHRLGEQYMATDLDLVDPITGNKLS